MERDDDKAVSETAAKSDTVGDNADSVDLDAAEKWQSFVGQVLGAFALLTPTVMYGWCGYDWWKTLLLTALYALAKLYFKCAMAVTVFGCLSDAVAELLSEDKDVRKKAENRFVRESTMPMTTFDAFVILSFGLSRLVGCI